MKKLLVVFLLGFSSGLPLALLSSTLQAWFADSGASVLTTGMLSLVGLPYIYRVVWAPIMDRYALTSMGKRRSWIISTQIILFIGFNILAFLTPQQSPHFMALVAFLLALFSATQDAAIDAHRTEYLPVSQHALGASLAVLGYRVALLLSGGLALVIAAQFGWRFTYHLMALFMGFGVVATILSPEPSKAFLVRPKLSASFVAPFYELWQRKDMGYLLLFILFFKLGEAFTATTSGIVMPFLIQGIGFSLATIGYINKILALVAILLGGLLAGLLLLRWTLYRALLVFGLLQALSNALFIALAVIGKNIPLFAVTVFCDNFATGMGTTALVAFLMRVVNQQFTATQFSLLVAVSTIPRILSGPIAAMIQMSLGWTGLYQLAFILSFAFIPFLMKIKNQTQDGNAPLNEIQTKHGSEMRDTESTFRLQRPVKPQKS